MEGAWHLESPAEAAPVPSAGVLGASCSTTPPAGGTVPALGSPTPGATRVAVDILLAKQVNGKLKN